MTSKAKVASRPETRDRLADRDATVTPPRGADTAADLRAVRDRLNLLRLSRARTASQLEGATNPAYRAMLERTLSALDAEAAQLSAAERGLRAAEGAVLL